MHAKRIDGHCILELDSSQALINRIVVREFSRILRNRLNFWGTGLEILRLMNARTTEEKKAANYEVTQEKLLQPDIS